jgi:hypothetical protein
MSARALSGAGQHFSFRLREYWLTSEGLKGLSVLISCYLRNAGESNRHDRIKVANRF